jgi:glycosyltransferase involved in cell wall biosynthesis
MCGAAGGTSGCLNRSDHPNRPEVGSADPRPVYYYKSIITVITDPARRLAVYTGSRDNREPGRSGTLKVIEATNTDFALRHFLLPLLLGLRARGHEAIGLCPEGPLVAIVREQGFRVIAVPMARSLSPLAQYRALRALLAVLRAERPDLVHGHMPISGFLTRLAARLTGVRKIAYTCHGFLFNQPGPWPRRAAAWVMEFVGARLTDVFMTVSQQEARDAARMGITRRAVAVGNGRDPSLFVPDPAARVRLRQELGTAPERVVVVIVSRLVRPKGHEELLQAMRSVDAELWVVGERLASDHAGDLEAAFAASGLGDRLRRLGYREDIPAILAAADIFVLPSWFEALPMAVIEAMFCGLPIVASDITGPREQVVQGETGLLVPARQIAPLAEALRLLAADAALRARMGAAGRARAVALYDERRVVERVLDLLGA